MSPDVASSEASFEIEESARPAPGPGDVELSVVMPCLNESDTLETCIRKAPRAMATAGIQGEVVVDELLPQSPRHAALTTGTPASSEE